MKRQCALLALAFASLASGAEPPRIVIPRAAHPPRLEEYSGSVPPQHGIVVSGFTQRNPKDGAPATLPTTAYLSYDDKSFYAVVVCQDDPSKLRAHIAKREELLDDDFIALDLDTFHDRQRHYRFFLNPYGVQRDAIYTEGQGGDPSFDTFWRSEAAITREGYIAVFSIPFKSLRFPESERQSWGIALWRAIPRNNEEDYWPAVSSKVEGLTQQFATAEGIEGVSPGRNIRLIPYMLGGLGRSLDTPAAGDPRFGTHNELRGGVDAKVVLRDALTLDLTVNPDFSQIEADEPQVTVNQRYEVIFPELRPFFQENAAYFQTPLNLFFSRRIIDPQFGARLTGKLGRWSVGALVADDRAAGQGLASGDPNAGDRAEAGIVSARREFARQSNLGVLATVRKFGDESNEVLSIDTRLKLSPTWVLTGQAVESLLESKGQSRQTGAAYDFNLSRVGRQFSFETHYSDIAPRFQTQLGYIQRTGIRDSTTIVSYNWRPEKRVVSYGPLGVVRIIYDHSGRMTDLQFLSSFNMEMKGPINLQITREDDYEYYGGLGFNHGETNLSVNYAALKRLRLSTNLTSGARINYAPTAAIPAFVGGSRTAQAQLTLLPTAQLRFDLTYFYTRLAAREHELFLAPLGPGAPVVFTDHLMRLKVNQQFTRALSFRGILDYHGLSVNQALTSDVPGKRLTADLLLTYLLHPGTALYAGYTNQYENLLLNTLANPTLTRTGAPTLSTGRVLFVKLSYLFRF